MWSPQSFEDEFYGDSSHRNFDIIVSQTTRIINEESDSNIQEEPTTVQFHTNPFKLAAAGCDIFSTEKEKEITKTLQDISLKYEGIHKLDPGKTIPQPLPDIVMDISSTRPIVLDTKTFGIPANLGPVEFDKKEVEERHADNEIPVKNKFRTLFQTVEGDEEISESLGPASSESSASSMGESLPLPKYKRLAPITSKDWNYKNSVKPIETTPEKKGRKGKKGGKTSYRKLDLEFESEENTAAPPGLALSSNRALYFTKSKFS